LLRRAPPIGTPLGVRRKKAARLAAFFHWRLWRHFGVRARAVVRIPCEGVDLIAGRVLTASLVRRRAAVDVIQVRVRQNA
jgi:hypothetical protein